MTIVMDKNEISTQPRVRVPQHVAVVMDGNGRWAKKRFLPRVAGHKKGVESVRAVIRAAAKAGVKNLTLFAFSSENWKRPSDEVQALMTLFMQALTNEVQELHKSRVRIRLVGDLSRFSPALQQKIQESHHLTENNDGLNLNICVNYGGRWEIVEACKKIVEKCIPSQEITEDLFAQNLQIPDSGDVDLFIRTSAESRISNFLLWQLAYSELYFTPVLWPDFNEEEFNKALDWFAERERRFGKTSEQISLKEAQ